ncbi:MAG: nucleotidyltransferase [Pyrobaculum sp.]|uniref:nucleotidyltransferase n=1 Tax=unclassified Pyrobaculum TaxID=2643434 RepID=UPI0021D9DC44|nr:nucleotidyltransferase [Pyrobaculum sp. 3827-6]MCU7788849.1 nucleotidyltransferase [Pyrobaculum sp. 3827-6]
MRLDKYKTALEKVAKSLNEKGVEHVLIGSAILPFLYNIDYDPRDLDIFVINKSTVLDNELFEEIAEENDWDMGTSDHGTIYYELIVGGETVRVDLLENILDIYIPPELLADLREVDVDGVRVRAIGLEQLLVLKAKIATKEAEDFINEVARYVLERGIKLDYDKIRKYAGAYPEDAEGILKRLRRNGIYVE